VVPAQSAMQPTQTMVVNKVALTADAMMTCLVHALSTEREEIMGLLVGELTGDHEEVCEITNLLIIKRVDKRKDRVEISPEQLAQASTEAERIGHECQKGLRIVGWYHSHPHITVWPSHVDVRTQYDYQRMDPTFIGLIFAGFAEDAPLKGRVQVTCFQSVLSAHSGHARREIPMEMVPVNHITPTVLATLSSLPERLFEEEQELFMQVQQAAQSNEPQIKVHNSGVYTAALCRLLDRVCAPMLRALEERVSLSRRKLAELTKEKERLQASSQAVAGPVQ